MKAGIQGEGAWVLDAHLHGHDSIEPLHSTAYLKFTHVQLLAQSFSHQVLTRYG